MRESEQREGFGGKCGVVGDQSGMKIELKLTMVTPGHFFSIIKLDHLKKTK